MTNRKGNSRKGRTRLKTDPAIKGAIVAGKVGGQAQKVIADKLQISESTVSRIANAEETRALVEQASVDLVHNGLRLAVKNSIDTMTQSNKAGLHPDKAMKPFIGLEGQTVTDSKGEPVKVYDKDYHKGLIDMRKLSAKVEENILKTTGLLPTHAMSIHVENLININESNTLAPTVRGVVEHYTDDLVIDAEYSDDD